MSTTPKIALVAGATGLVGGFLLKTLLDAPDYSRVYALTRRPFGKEHPKLANRVVIFDRMAEQLKGLVAQDAFCCIGTTIAEAGSQEAFREADVDAVLLFARAARAAQATRFVVVSSVGASSHSKKFYLRTKGEMEEAVTDLGFASVDILQPSLLLGPRKALRPLEITGQHLRAAHQSAAHGCARSPIARSPRRPWPGRCSVRRGVARVARIATPMRASASSSEIRSGAAARGAIAQEEARLNTVQPHS